MSVASRWGIGGACGIFLGDTILMVLSTSGVAPLLHANPALLFIVKYAGTGYLGWQGMGLMGGAVQRWRNQETPPSTATLFDASRPFRTALFISLMNLKAILLFVSFLFSSYNQATRAPELSFFILGILVQLCSAIHLSILFFGGAHLATQDPHQRHLDGGRGHRCVFRVIVTGDFAKA